MVRTVGGECTGSCRLGHVFLTFPFALSEYLLLLRRSTLFLRTRLFISAEGATRKLKSVERRGREREGAPRHVEEGGEGTRRRENEVHTPTLFLPLARLFYLSFPPVRHGGRAEHYNSSFSLYPVLVVTFPTLLFVSSSSVLPLSPPSSCSTSSPRLPARLWSSTSWSLRLWCTLSCTARRDAGTRGSASRE